MDSLLAQPGEEGNTTVVVIPSQGNTNEKTIIISLIAAGSLLTFSATIAGIIMRKKIHNRRLREQQAKAWPLRDPQGV
jgi:hypothetical protein